MLQIKCPYCGTRDEIEFSFDCEPGVPRPELTVSDQEWATYLFAKTNAKGVQRERWFHRFGCNQWFGVERNTVTHEIHSVFELGSSVSEVSE